MDTNIKGRTWTDHSFKWIVASLIFWLVIMGDVAHAFYYFDEAARIPFFIAAVFGADMALKLKAAALMVLLIAGCEVAK